jgi:DNA-binding CsgD family transcriptional regulator
MKRMADAGLTQEEMRYAILLIEGNTRTDIMRRLHTNSTEMERHEKAIVHKLNLMGGVDPVIAATVSQYGLTKREREILVYLRGYVSNEEIAAALFISEETVRTHIHNLMRKIPAKRRQDIPVWLESLGRDNEQTNITIW